MANIEPLKSGAFRARIHRAGQDHSATFDTRAEAEKWRAEILSLMKGDRHRERLATKQITLADALERRFWHYVETDTPPPADGSDSAALTLQCLYPHDQGHSIDFSEEREMSWAFASLVSLRQEIADRETQEAFLKQSIRQRWRSQPGMKAP